MGEAFRLQLELFCLQLSFFAYSQFNCSDTRNPTESKTLKL